MELIQEIKKRQEKIDANTERIFKLQQVKRHSDYAQLIASLISDHMK